MHAEQRGYSLVEFMLAAVLGTLVATLAGYTYLGATRHFKRLQQITGLHDNGQLAMLSLLRHLRRAGYLGYYAGTGPVLGTAGKHSSGSRCIDGQPGQTLRLAVTGIDQDTPSRRCPAASAASYPYATGDLVTVRYARHRTGNGYAANRLYLRSTLTSARLFSGRRRKHESNRLKTRYPDLALQQHTFYLSHAQTTACSGTATVPVLIDRTMAPNGRLRHRVIADGIEQLQFQYGVLKKRDLRYRNASAVSDWNRVVSIRLWLLVRSECPDKTYHRRQTYRLGDYWYSVDDAYRRTLFSTTVFLPNRYQRVKRHDE